MPAMPSDEPDPLATVDELLALARSEIDRLTPSETLAALRNDAVLVDIRPSEQRDRDGHIPGARVIPRNVLEWRLDPQSEHRDPEVARLDRQVIVICDQGYQSSLAAATLRRFGLDAADMIGGVQSWREEGLPLSGNEDGEKAVHWRRKYGEHGTEELSWTEATPRLSLELIQEAALPLDAAIVDVGGGASRLAAELVGLGHTDVTVVDIAAEALERARSDLGQGAANVTWVEADIRAHEFDRTFDLWHDRALFHFLVSAPDHDAYLALLGRTLNPGGNLILATFGPDGPTRCSGLPVRRYDAEAISQTLGADFELVSSQLAEHRTPSGSNQQFLYAHLKRSASPG
jgi:rhodanese-related sulfurtransferase/ubiquinone/menaquinone biosynthesis C-methylase UbiE